MIELIKESLLLIFNRKGIMAKLAFIAFVLSFLSIPLCSFHPFLNLVTWIFTGLFIIFGLVSLLKKKALFVDSIVVSLALFSVFAILSSVFTGFRSFVLTPVYLSIVSAFVYIFMKSFKHMTKFVFFAIYLVLIVFLIVFILNYFKELATLNFDRLGGIFGDTNDISIFLGMGFIFSFLYFLKEKNILIKIILSFIMALFVYTGLSTGSKVFILALFGGVIVTPLLYFGLKKWYISFCIFIIIFLLLLFLLASPFFGSLRTRLASFINTIFGFHIDGGYTDYSSIHRTQMFLNGMEMFLRRPLFGYGIRGFYAFSSFGYAWSHNNFSESLLSFGLIGTCLFHYGFAYSIIGYYLKKKRTFDSAVSLSLLFFFFFCMFSVAIKKKKIYAYCIGICFSHLTETKKFYILNFWRKRS